MIFVIVQKRLFTPSSFIGNSITGTVSLNRQIYLLLVLQYRNFVSGV